MGSDNPTETEVMILKTFTLFSGTLSVLGSGFIITTFLLYSDLRTPARRFLVALSISDIFVAFFNAFGSLYDISLLDYTFCTVQSAITTYFSIASFFWTAGLAVYLYLALSWDLKSKAAFVSVPYYTTTQGVTEQTILQQRKDSGWKVFGVFSLVCWGVPALIIGVSLGNGALGGDEYSNSLGWCWIAYDETKQFLFWGLAAGKAWEIASYFVTAIFYVLSKRRLQAIVNERHCGRGKESANKVDQKLLLVPVFFVFVRIWGTVRFFLEVFNKSHDYQLKLFWLTAIQGMGDSSQGFVDFILFCVLTNKVRERVVSVFLCERQGRRDNRALIGVNQDMDSEDD